MIYTLNEDQEMIKNLGILHLDRSCKEQVFEFTGGAGSGKSVVLNEIADGCSIDRSKIAPMAYTGSAAMVMRTKGFTNARTIHSWLYTPIPMVKKDKFGNILKDEYYGTDLMDLQFSTKNVEQYIEAFFIDEGWMVPLHMKKDIESRGKKIIVAGDRNQLDPVADLPAYLTGPNVKVLSQIMRQKLDSGILYLALRSLYGYPINRGFYGDALVIDKREITDDMLMGADIVLCGTNKSREYYNRYIREGILGITSKIPVFMDKVICRQNNWNIELGGINLTNGIIGYVNTPVDIGSLTKKTFKMDFMPLLLNSPFMDLEIDYEYFSAKDVETKNMLKQSKYGLGEKFELAYSITVHLSQGSEYNNVLYIEEYNPQQQNKINYTAITRAKQKLIYAKM